MTIEDFLKKVKDGGTVPLSMREWEELAPSFPVVTRHNTQLAGDLLIVEGEGVLLAIEQPSRDARVARLLGTPHAAKAFVEKRLEEYERMWDGCGVKIDYFEDS